MSLAKVAPLSDERTAAPPSYLEAYQGGEGLSAPPTPSSPIMSPHKLASVSQEVNLSPGNKLIQRKVNWVASPRAKTDRGSYLLDISGMEMDANKAFEADLMQGEEIIDRYYAYLPEHDFFNWRYRFTQRCILTLGLYAVYIGLFMLKWIIIRFFRNICCKCCCRTSMSVCDDSHQVAITSKGRLLLWHCTQRGEKNDTLGCIQRILSCCFPWLCGGRQTYSVSTAISSTHVSEISAMDFSYHREKKSCCFLSPTAGTAREYTLSLVLYLGACWPQAGDLADYDYKGLGNAIITGNGATFFQMVSHFFGSAFGPPTLTQGGGHSLLHLGASWEGVQRIEILSKSIFQHRPCRMDVEHDCESSYMDLQRLCTRLLKLRNELGRENTGGFQLRTVPPPKEMKQFEMVDGHADLFKMKLSTMYLKLTEDETVLAAIPVIPVVMGLYQLMLSVLTIGAYYYFKILPQKRAKKAIVVTPYRIIEVSTWDRGAGGPKVDKAVLGEAAIRCTSYFTTGLSAMDAMFLRHNLDDATFGMVFTNMHSIYLTTSLQGLPRAARHLQLDHLVNFAGYMAAAVEAQLMGGIPLTKAMGTEAVPADSPLARHLKGKEDTVAAFFSSRGTHTDPSCLKLRRMVSCGYSPVAQTSDLAISNCAVMMSTESANGCINICGLAKQEHLVIWSPLNRFQGLKIDAEVINNEHWTTRCCNMCFPGQRCCLLSKGYLGFALGILGGYPARVTACVKEMSLMDFPEIHRLRSCLSIIANARAPDYLDDAAYGGHSVQLKQLPIVAVPRNV
jgi:hypothetical protein